jgi:acetate kinase
MDTILVVNSGSSSVKFQVFGVNGARTLDRVIKGQVSGIGTMPRLKATGADGSTLADESYPATEVDDVADAIQVAGKWLREKHAVIPFAVGHRVVHGGPSYDKPVLVDAQLLDELEKLVCLAPLHQPHNLATMRRVLERFPDLPQVACFDTAFHRTHSSLADRYAIPENYYDEGIRRYGFHGLSYEYIATALPHIAPEIADKKIIVAHLGSGASMCALSARRSVECTLGFTALDGLPMGTRAGQIDPGVILYLIGQKGMSADAVQDLLYNECGLLGLSGLSNDARELEASNDPRAQFALDYFAYRAALNAGMLAAALGGIDAIVFTAGIGENSDSMRARIADRLAWLGAALNPAANAIHSTYVSTPQSRVALLVIPTNEELMIARHTLALIDQSHPAQVY